MAKTLTIVFDKKAEIALEELRSKGENQADVIKKALATYNHLNNELQKGNKIGVLDSKGKPLKEIILP